MTRRGYHRLVFGIGLPLVAVTLFVVLDDRIPLGALSSAEITLRALWFWLLCPPLLLWLDWSWFCRPIAHDAPERASIRHSHTLARQVWLAMVAALLIVLYVRDLASDADVDDEPETGLSAAVFS